MRNRLNEPPEKIFESFGFTFARRSRALCRMATKAQQARLVRMQFRTELRDTLAKRNQKPGGRVLLLESDDKVIVKAQHDDITAHLTDCSALDPEIEHMLPIKAAAG